MYILLAAATHSEIEPVTHFLKRHEFVYGDNKFGILVTGIGSMHTMYSLMSSLRTVKPDYMIQAGIGGSFSATYPPGSLVLVQEEYNGDLGVEENGVFKDVFDMNLLPNDAPYINRSLVNPGSHNWKQYELPFVTGITVNEITTNAARIQQLKKKYEAGVESMEGAAFHLTALMEKIPFIQVRAISNYVGERDKTKWKMKEAIQLLNDQLIKMIADNKWK